MKKVFFAFLMLCFIVPITMEAKKKSLGQGLFWELDKSGVLTISGNGKMYDYDGEIGSDKVPWYKNRSSIYKVIIEEGVQTIGGHAFFQCDQMESCLIPNSVHFIGSYSFMGCRKIKSIIIPDNVTYISDGAFMGCSSLTNVILPKSLKVIRGGTFRGCMALSKIAFPQSLVVIGRDAFEDCNLQEIDIPNSIERIEEHAFGRYYDKQKKLIVSLPSWITQTGKEPEYYGISKQSWDAYINGVRNEHGRLLLAATTNRKIGKCTDKANNTFYLVEENETTGLMSSEGKWIVPLGIYLKLSPIEQDYILIHNNSFYGIINYEGKVIIPISKGYKSINFDRNNGTFAFTKKGFSGVCDALGREISTTRLAPTADDIMTDGGYASAVEIKNGSTKYYKVSKGGRYGLTDSEGKEIIPCEMEALESAGTGYLKYKINGFWGVMNYTGKIIIDTDRGYTSIGDFITFTKRFPYAMAGYKGECDINGRQISKIKVETPKQTVSSNSSSTSNSSSSSNSNSNTGSEATQTVVVEHHRDPVPIQEWQQCVACFGSGQCPYVRCGGSGWYYIGDRVSTCSMCHGSGKCSTCAGKGGQYVTVYR